ncbi:uncharacterized protein LOC121728634 isoform X8 [Aricia agestis]|uniref:uncharacterized protein LOC121728634 isoform X8 n=1 Tax=Aricia agestis TaxID=91739 RepID=UPI001C203FFA|nr:uncharacterized protein LOC121728634 isoform X8 [Aricia agestis]
MADMKILIKKRSSIKSKTNIEMLSEEADSAASLVEREDFDRQFFSLVALTRSLLGSSVSNGSEAGFRDADSALVNVTSATGKKYTARLLLDNGSTANFVTQSFVEKLGLSLRGTSTKVTDANISRLDRWKRVQHIRTHFWGRFHNEYTSLLQVKTKWFASRGELKPGSLVLIKDKMAPPLLWSLGRVIKTYPGVDGVTRVAELKTRKGTIRRAFNSICPLPID